MTAKSAKRFPSAPLVIALFVASGALWAVLALVTLPHLQHLANGAAPFDLRRSGYSYEEARQFLDAIGEQGRAYYLNPELLLDTFFPPLYAGLGALVLWWLTMPGRLRAGATPAVWRWALIALPVAELIFDWGENACIAAMIWTWPDLSPVLVRVSSVATRLKYAVVALTAISLVALAAAALLRRYGRRG